MWNSSRIPPEFQGNPLRIPVESLRILSGSPKIPMELPVIPVGSPQNSRVIHTKFQRESLKIPMEFPIIPVGSPKISMEFPVIPVGSPRIPVGSSQNSRGIPPPRIPEGSSPEFQWNKIQECPEQELEKLKLGPCGAGGFWGPNGF